MFQFLVKNLLEEWIFFHWVGYQLDFNVLNFLVV